jgi:hypothetical protein
MFTDSDSAQRFDRVECDLSDVLGTPGVGDPGEVAARFGQSLGLEFDALPARRGLYLRGEVVGAFDAAPMELADAAYAFDHTLSVTTRTRRRVRVRPWQETGLRKVAKVKSPSAVHESYVQTMDGRRVIGGSYRLHEGPTTTQTAETTLSVTGSPIGDLAERDPGPAPKPRRAAVLGAMHEQLGLSSKVKLRLETVLFPLEGGAVWAYLGRGMYRHDDTIADLRIIVRAEDHSLLVSRDAAISAISAAFGEGDVFHSNPLRDRDTTTTVRLPELTGAELLSTMLDVSPSVGTRPQRPLRDWRGAVADAAFDDVSAYYHLSRAASWFTALVGADLFKTKPFRPLKVITGERASRGVVGQFIPSEGVIAFGDGPRPGARSADICIHEFTHAVVWAAHRIDEVSPVEARGLNEGWADYAQASLLDNALMGDWVRPGQSRDCSSVTVKFPANMATTTDPYAIGAAWAAVLWDIRTRVGAGVTDVLAFDTIFYLDETSSVDSALTALLDSDARLFPSSSQGTGRHADIINQAFNSRV